jgi:hypothetical protein
MSHAWRALRHSNFKLFFFGQSISVIGTWMTRLATSWLVYRMTHSALLLGVVSFAGQIVAFALGPIAGGAHAGARDQPLGNYGAHRDARLDQCV